ncbi:AAA family ATPase Gcn20 [Schizosaccharomyces japonicus yFS275]|uniref:AAA family ATPase Gcn20 n=1 Tax=Schizosaccharomyces japonicus (strain yFS275 / FY16936) TaxID=402676 RepID=B6JVX6_SCHJY|nr:AAA family ATPase Gcn20 [Schizosaccharomyces japonicus yFS275]EEB05527.2 AAA family ATPase Gcn20 [Schizosaccharomyces japonicus yFS275]
MGSKNLSSTNIAMEQAFAAKFPDVDRTVLHYCSGFSSDALKDVDQVAEQVIAFISNLLLDAGADQNGVKSIQKELEEKFHEREQNVDILEKNKLVRLKETIRMDNEAEISSTLGLVGDKVDLGAVKGKTIETRVDKRKLEKAERKIRAKWEKRTIKAEYESSKLIQPEQKSYEEFYMSVNPLDLTGNNQGKSKDVKIDGIDLAFAGNRILTNASLTLAQGRRYGLTGRNGVGKSTLLRALSRREIAVPTHITILHVEQEITGDDTPVLQSVLDADVWRKYLLNEQAQINEQLANIERELEELAQDKDADQAVARRLERTRDDLDVHLMDIQNKLAEMDSDRAESRAATILAGLGFDQEMQSHPTKSFSGGWRMRLSLARALFCQPDLLLLDEPSNMLDVPSIAFLANYLKTYKNIVLVVSHDRSFLNEVATDIIHQHSERLDYYRGNFSQFYATREERRLNQLREYEKQMEYRKHLQTFIDKFRYNAAKSSEAQSRIKKLEKLPVLEKPQMENEVAFEFPVAEKISPPVLQMTDVSFEYVPGRPVLRHVDIDVQMDSRIGVVGPNGTGKSTMLKLLIEQLRPTSGLVSRHSRLRIAYFAQHHVDGLDLNLSALSFLAKAFPGRGEEEYRRHLGSFGVTGPMALQKMVTLSGGQKSRVAFACLGLQNPHILILDEPTNHLDMESMDALTRAIDKFNGGVILVSHDVDFLDKTCTSIWECDHGTITKFDGTIAQYKKHCLETQPNMTIKSV